MSPQQYHSLQPTLSLTTFFAQPVQGWGIIQDFWGNVVSRFDVSIQGTISADGTRLVLHEDFSYYTGTPMQRVWTFTQSADDPTTWVGAADDIIGTATGKLHGNAFHLRYTMDVPRGDKTIRLTFDDWMFLMHNGVIINRTSLQKFGITVAQLTLFLQQQPKSVGQ